MTTLQSHDAQMTRVASMPSIFGIATSMTTTSGTSRVACATASSPSDRLAQNLQVRLEAQPQLQTHPGRGLVIN